MCMRRLPLLILHMNGTMHSAVACEANYRLHTLWSLLIVKEKKNMSRLPIFSHKTNHQTSAATQDTAGDVIMLSFTAARCRLSVYITMTKSQGRFYCYLAFNYFSVSFPLFPIWFSLLPPVMMPIKNYFPNCSSLSVLVPLQHWFQPVFYNGPSWSDTTPSSLQVKLTAHKCQ